MNPYPWRVIREAKAWDEIGWDEGPFRIKGGTAIYQAVIYQCGPREGRTVMLARLGDYNEEGNPVGLKQTNRRVEPDTVLEFLAKPGEEVQAPGFQLPWVRSEPV